MDLEADGGERGQTSSRIASSFPSRTSFARKLSSRAALTHGGLAWSRAGEQPHARVNYEADLRTDKHAAIQLRYRLDDRNESTHVWLRYTEPQYGGRRWWFMCPLTGDRVAKLYLPPGQNRFASRRAYGLAYRSSRKSRSKSKTLDVLLRYTAKMRERILSRKPI